MNAMFQRPIQIIYFEWDYITWYRTNQQTTAARPAVSPFYSHRRQWSSAHTPCDEDAAHHILLLAGFKLIVLRFICINFTSASEKYGAQNNYIPIVFFLSLSLDFTSNAERMRALFCVLIWIEALRDGKTFISRFRWIFTHIIFHIALPNILTLSRLFIESKLNIWARVHRFHLCLDGDVYLYVES